MALLTRTEFQNLATTRFDDAKALLANGRYSGAYYLVGYAVECALKACIAKQTREFDFPDRQRVNQSWTHDLAQLLELAKIPARLDFDANSSLKLNWYHVNVTWTEAARYETVTADEAKAIVLAVADPQHGVLQWLRKYW